MLTALNRMLLWELARVFALALVGVTGIFLIGGVIQEGSRLGLGPDKLLQVIPLLVPSFLPYTIPATVLFAACVAYGRLANDNEVVAIKAAGVDLLTALWPAALLGLFGAAAVAAVSHSLIPRTQVQLQEEIARDPEEFLYAQLKRDRTIRGGKSPYALYVRDVQGRRLVDVIIKRKGSVEQVPGLGPRYRYDYVARAPEAFLRVDTVHDLLTVDFPRSARAAGKMSSVDTTYPQPIEMALPKIGDDELRTRPIALPWDALPARAAELRRQRAETEAKREATRRQAQVEPDPANVARLHEEDPRFAQQLKEADRNVRNAEYEFQARPALALSCVPFALIGCTVGMWFSRSDYLSAFVVCWIPTVILFFVPFFSGGGLAKDGKLPMAVGVWLADAVVGATAAVLVWRLVKR